MRLKVLYRAKIRTSKQFVKGCLHHGYSHNKITFHRRLSQLSVLNIGFPLIYFRLIDLVLTLADDEDLSRFVPGGLRLGGLHLLKELLEDPEQRLVVLGAEHLGDKGATLVRELRSQLQGHECQVSLGGKRVCQINLLQEYQKRSEYPLLGITECNLSKLCLKLTVFLTLPQ